MTKIKYLEDKDPWMLAEDIPDMDFFFSRSQHLPPKNGAGQLVMHCGVPFS